MHCCISIIKNTEIFCKTGYKQFEQNKLKLAFDFYSKTKTNSAN